MEETLEVSVSKSGGDGTSGSLFLVLLIREIRKCVCVGGISPCLKGKAAFSLSLTYISDTPGMAIF